MTTKLHDPVPDGKTGPWNREPHAKAADGGYAYDPRCDACETAFSEAFDAYVESRWEEEVQRREAEAALPDVQPGEVWAKGADEDEWTLEHAPEDDEPELPDHLMEAYLEDHDGWTHRE